MNQEEINKNSKEFLEKQLKNLDNDFNTLYERMNKKRKELLDLEKETNKETKKTN
jgi:predicted  nucleic acid-binding Zn-ribbon protein